MTVTKVFCDICKKESKGIESDIQIIEIAFNVLADMDHEVSIKDICWDCSCHLISKINELNPGMTGRILKKVRGYE